MKKKIILAVLLAAVAVTIFMLSNQPSTQSSKLSRGLTYKVLSVIPAFRELEPLKQQTIVASLQFVVRKGAHFTIYLVLGILSYLNALAYGIKYPRAASAAFCLLYAASDELHQYFVPGRSCELRDMSIDFAGCLVGIFAVYFIMKYHKNFRIACNSM